MLRERENVSPSCSINGSTSIFAGIADVCKAKTVVGLSALLVVKMRSFLAGAVFVGRKGMTYACISSRSMRFSVFSGKRLQASMALSQRIAKNDLEVFGIEGQAFWIRSSVWRNDTLAFGKGIFLCWEWHPAHYCQCWWSHQWRETAGSRQPYADVHLPNRRSQNNFPAQQSDCWCHAWIDVIRLLQNDFVHMFELAVHLLFKLLLFTNNLILLSHMFV